MPSKIITEQMKQEICDFYLSRPMSLKTVGEHFNLSNPTISKILKDIPKYPKARINNPNLNERFFESIDSEEKAYFLGLLISDGNVYKEDSTANRQSSISITLDLEDEYMLNEFKQVLNSNTSISKDGRGCGQIAVRSNLMAQDLSKYGVVPRKSFHTYLPKEIPDNLMNHLIRGIFDGDGNITAKLSKNNKYLHSFGFCGTHELMQNISDYITPILSLKQKPSVYDYKDKNLSEIKICNKDDMYKFGEWLYQNGNIFLIRKKETYLEFKKYYNLN